MPPGRIRVVGIRRAHAADNGARRLPVFNLVSKLVATSAKNIAASNSAKEPPFEEALKNLESIVDAMEAGDLPLEMLLARFEEGTRLIRICQAKLEEAELKIQKLEKTLTGGLALKPLEGAPDE